MNDRFATGCTQEQRGRSQTIVPLISYGSPEIDSPEDHAFNHHEPMSGLSQNMTSSSHCAPTPGRYSYPNQSYEPSSTPPMYFNSAYPVPPPIPGHHEASSPFGFVSSYPPSPQLHPIALPTVSRTNTPDMTPTQHFPKSHSLLPRAMYREGPLATKSPRRASHMPSGSLSALGIYDLDEEPSRVEDSSSRRRKSMEEADDEVERECKRTRGRDVYSVSDHKAPPLLFARPTLPRIVTNNDHWNSVPPVPSATESQEWQWQNVDVWGRETVVTPPYSGGFDSRARSSRKLSESSTDEDYFSRLPLTRLSNASSSFALLTPLEPSILLPEPSWDPEQNSSLPSTGGKCLSSRSGFDKPQQNIRSLSESLRDALSLRTRKEIRDAMDDDDDVNADVLDDRISAMRTIVPSPTSHNPTKSISVPHQALYATTSLPNEREASLHPKLLRDDITLEDVEVCLVLQNIRRDEQLLQQERANPGSAGHIGKFRDRENEKAYDEGAIAEAAETQPVGGKGAKNGVVRPLKQGTCNNCGITEKTAVMWRSDAIITKDLGLKRRLCNRCGLYKQTNGCDRPILRPWIHHTETPSDPSGGHTPLPKVSSVSPKACRRVMPRKSDLDGDADENSRSPIKGGSLGLMTDGGVGSQKRKKGNNNVHKRRSSANNQV